MSTPRAAIISRSDSPALIRMPRRVRAIRKKSPGCNEQPDQDDREAEDRVVDAARERDRAGEKLGAREIERKGAEHPARSLGKDQNQREGGEHLIEMVAAVEPPDDGDLHDGARCGSGRQARREPDPEGAGRGGDGRAGEGADHVERTVGEVDEAHDAEDQRQPAAIRKSMTPN